MKCLGRSELMYKNIRDPEETVVAVCKRMILVQLGGGI